MKEKIKQKGFIQTPLLIAILSSVILVSVVITGGVLLKQGKLKLTANISESSKQAQQEQTVSSSLSTELAQEEQKIETKIEQKIEQKPKLIDKKLIQEKPIVEQATSSIIQSIPEATKQTIVPQAEEASATTQIEIIRQQIIQINEERDRTAAEKIRKERCAVVNSQQEEDDYNGYVAHAQKEVDYLTDYIASFDDPNSDAYKFWKTAGGRDAEYYKPILAQKVDELNHQVDVRNKFYAEKTACNN